MAVDTYARTLAIKAMQDGSGYDDTEVRELIAQRAKNHTFDTYNDMVDWLSNDDNKSSLIQGDGLFILAEDTPDYWWNGDNVEPYEANDTVAQSMAEEAIGIAKGRATGYVFDTKDDMDEWLEDEDNVEKLVLGDNFYIRDLDVPDYWWDGTQPQELETQKVDLADYVKDTDYATVNKGGVIKLRSGYGANVTTDGYLISSSKTQTEYNNLSEIAFISKGTLENIKESLSDTKIIKGQGSPTSSTIGTIGLLYEDTTNGELYICTAINPPSFTWTKIVLPTDYATDSKGGVIKTSTSYGTNISYGFLVGVTKSRTTYKNSSTYTFVSKGTLENLAEIWTFTDEDGVVTTKKVYVSPVE